MHPTVCGLPAYPTFITLGVISGVATCWIAGNRWGLSPARFTVAIALVAAIAFAGSKGQSLLERGEVASLGWELANGFRFTGGIAGGVVALLMLVKLGAVNQRPWRVLDSIALAVCAAMPVVRIGCFLEGCCFGSVWNGSLGVSFPAKSPAWHAQVIHGLIRPDRTSALPVHPLQLYFGLWSALLFSLLVAVGRRRPRPGTIFLLFLSIGGIAQCFLEEFRFEPVLVNSVAGLGASVAAATWLIWRHATTAPACSSEAAGVHRPQGVAQPTSL